MKVVIFNIGRQGPLTRLPVGLGRLSDAHSEEHTTPGLCLSADKNLFITGVLRFLYDKSVETVLVLKCIITRGSGYWSGEVREERLKVTRPKKEHLTESPPSTDNLNDGRRSSLDVSAEHAHRMDF